MSSIYVCHGNGQIDADAPHNPAQVQPVPTPRRAHRPQIQCAVPSTAPAPVLHNLGRRVGGFSDVPTTKAKCCRGASRGTGCGGRVHQKGRDFWIRHASSFAPSQLVIQQVIPSYLFIEAPMKQIELPLLCRLDAPAVVPPSLIAQCKTYRDAVKLCWSLRRVRNMTRRQLAETAGLYPSHVTCYLEDSNRMRDLPGGKVKEFEWACGNTAISQWHSVGAKLTVVEEMQAMRLAA